MAYGKKVEKNRLSYLAVSFLICLAIVYLLFNVTDAWRKYKESTKRLEASTASVSELTKQHENLKKAQALENSITGYEKHVRSKFDLSKEGEQAVFIFEDEVPVPLKEEKSIKKIFNSFKNFFN